ncbi:MAG: putative manganese-dependent inorganic diphosphatase [Syntrophomonadales bacterium]|jgi:manganese-dependent inorganic pyrophosphatase
MKKHPIIIIGHKNPDVDSIASAIAYTRLKQLAGETNVIAGTAGELNRETSHILQTLGIEPPVRIKDVRARVEDLLAEEEPDAVLSPDMRLQDAGNLLRNRKSKTVAVVDAEKRLLGLVTIGDLAMILMDGLADLSSPDEAGDKVQAIFDTRLAEIMKTDSLIIFDDHDSVAEAREMMLKTRYRNYPVTDDENRFLGMVSRYHLLSMKRKQVILVDHNEKTQAVDGVEEAELLEVIDHHRVGDLESITPIYFRNEPVGATCTLITEMYREKGQVPDKATAGLLLAGILSDTMIFRSPTTTGKDRQMAKWLSALSGLEIEAWGREIFREASPLDINDTRQAINEDLKEYRYGNVTFAVAQIETADMKLLQRHIPAIKETMHEISETRGYDLMFLMVTDIFVEGTQLLIAGEKSDLGRRIFEDADQGEVFLKGVLSRKKQIVPLIFKALAQNEMV